MHVDWVNLVIDVLFCLVEVASWRSLAVDIWYLIVILHQLAKISSRMVFLISHTCFMIGQWNLISAQRVRRRHVTPELRLCCKVGALAKWY